MSSQIEPLCWLSPTNAAYRKLNCTEATAWALLLPEPPSDYKEMVLWCC